VKTLANPVLLRAAVVLFCGCFSFLLALICMRALRKRIQGEDISSETSPGLEAMPMHVYNTVIHELQQQKGDLVAQSQAEQQRARANEALAQAILTNLSCGVLTFGTNGLVKASNPAARSILGFASLTGMGIEDIFRDASIPGPVRGGANPASSEPLWLADEVREALRQCPTLRRVCARYENPEGTKQDIAITLFRAPSTDAINSSVVCLVDDFGRLSRSTLQESASEHAEAASVG
jgi:nitrogen fixation/metabolism regulation signal transduction histidine kinase